MINFKDSLHPAFFWPNSGSGPESFDYDAEVLDPAIVEAEGKKMKELSAQVEAVKTQEVIKPISLQLAKDVVTETDSMNEWLWNASLNAVWAISKEYSDMDILKEYRSKFITRLRMQNSEGQDYYKVFDSKVESWYNHLMQSLEEAWYFKSEWAKTREEIAEMYKQSIYKKYKKYIWESNNKVFDKSKDTIFWKDFEWWYAPNEIYEELTWGTIFVSNKEDLRAYHIEWKEYEWEAPKTTIEERKKFLAHKLPNYLFEIKDTAWIARLFARVDRVTDTEKKWIEKFIELASNLQVKEWEDVIPEVALLKAFRDPEIQSNSPDYKRKKVLERYGLVVDDSLVRDLQKAWRFFLESQDFNNWLKDQRTLYLTILGVIYDYGGMDNAIASFSGEVDDYETRVKAERWRAWRQMASWELLKDDADYQSFVNALVWKKLLVDAKSATRLFQMKDEDLQKADVEDILADINNDGELTNWDRWATKTWLQFKEILNTLPDKEEALDNLLDHAELMNSVLWLGLEEDVFTIDNIKSDKRLILLLQAIISQPWEDIRPLLVHGVDGMEKSREFSRDLPESKDDPRVQEAARKFVENLIEGDKLKSIDWLEQINDPDWLMQAVAWGLYSEYMRGVGLGGRLSFDNFVKWLGLNLWVQWGKDFMSLWVSLSYNREIDLWKWWSVAGWASVWYVPLYKFSEWTLKHWFYWSVWLEEAKQWVSDKWVAQKLSFSQHFTFNGLPILSGSIWYSRDRLEWLYEGAGNKGKEFSEKIISPVLDQIADYLWDNAFDLGDRDIANKVREILEANIKGNIAQKEFNKLKRGELEASVDSALRFLTNYNGYDIKNESVRALVSGLIAEQYASAWAYARENKIDKRAYISWVSVWLSWIVGTSTFIAHWWLQITKHSRDTYGDVSVHEYDVDKWVRVELFNQEALDIINRNINAKENTKLRMEWEYVLIPKAYADDYSIKVNQDMKKLMKLDKDWNILLDYRTPIFYKTLQAAWRRSAVLHIGWESENGINMQAIQGNPDWFLSDEESIDWKKLPWRELVYTAEDVDRVLAWIKETRPGDGELQKYAWNVQEVLDKLEKWKSYKIIFTKGAAWAITYVIEENKDWDWIDVEYKEYHEQRMMSEVAEKVSEEMYAQAKLVKSNALHNIGHPPTEWKAHKAFANAMAQGDYEEAKAQLKAMLVDWVYARWFRGKLTMDQYINMYQVNNKVKFKETIRPVVQNLSGAELWQVLMSVNNLFARVAWVKWWSKDGEYKFVDWHGQGYSERNVKMSSAIEERAVWIRWTINSSKYLEKPIKEAYGNLIGAMEDYRKANPEYYNTDHKASEQMRNAMWINLWNLYNPENPLFNPEIYAGSNISIDKLEFTWKDDLHRHALEIFAKNKALMAPILKWLGFDENTEVKVLENQTGIWEITLDINGKNVILKWDLSVGYFAQCINHMLLLSNIDAVIDWWGAGYHTWPAIMWWSAAETNKGEAYSTTRIHIGVAGNLGWDSGTKSDDATIWWPKPNSDPGGQEVPKEPDPAGDWQNTNSWDIR